MCELEDSVTSLGFMLQVLMQQKGGIAQLDDSGELVLELKIAIAKPEGGDRASGVV